MKPNWIVVANASQARVLQTQDEGALFVVQSFTHPESRSKGSELTSDKAGMEKSDSGFHGGAAFQPRTDARQKEHAVFARELAAYLEHAALQCTFGQVALFASSPFLGELKAHLGPASQRLLGSSHDLDLTSFGLAEVEQRVARELAAPHGTA